MFFLLLTHVLASKISKNTNKHFTNILKPIDSPQSQTCKINVLTRKVENKIKRDPYKI